MTGKILQHLVEMLKVPFQLLLKAKFLPNVGNMEIMPVTVGPILKVRHFKHLFLEQWKNVL